MTKLVAHIDPYTLGDSAEGIAQAAVEGYLGIDLNSRTCRANRWRPWRRIRRMVIVHWSNWWEHGFEPMPGKSVPRKPIEKLTLDQVLSLWSTDGHHRIMTAEHALVLCQVHGLIPCFELKPSIWPRSVLRSLADLSRAAKWPAVAMTIQAYGRNWFIKARWERAAYARMAKSKAAGLFTMLLWRRPVNWARWSPVLDAVKDHPGHGDVANVGVLLKGLHATAVASRPTR
jgi:hypothetical protein